MNILILFFIWNIVHSDIVYFQEFHWKMVAKAAIGLNNIHLTFEELDWVKHVLAYQAVSSTTQDKMTVTFYFSTDAVRRLDKISTE